MMKYTVLVLATMLLAACGESADSRYHSGYDDGYAVGYNTTCQVRRTNIVKGDWDDENYSRGYRNGHADGAKECKEEED
jgi:hypothetical protein